MTVDAIRDLIYSDTNTSSTQISTSLVYDWMNIAYHDLVETIKNDVDPNYFFESFTDDTVVDQSIYTPQVPGAAQTWLGKVIQVWIKWSDDDTYFQEVRYEDANNLKHLPDWYEVNQPTTDPFFLIREDDIYIYPAPKNAVTNGIRFDLSIVPIDLVSAGAETTVKIPRQFHEGIAIWARRNVYARRSMPEMETDSINKFNEFKQRMTKSMRRRLVGPVRRQIPNLTRMFN